LNLAMFARLARLIATSLTEKSRGVVVAL